MDFVDYVDTVDIAPRDGQTAEWGDEEERARLRREVIEGCIDMAEVYLEIEREWHSADEEVTRAYTDWPSDG